MTSGILPETALERNSQFPRCALTDFLSNAILAQQATLFLFFITIGEANENSKCTEKPEEEGDRKLLFDGLCVAGVVGWVKHNFVSIF
jgi:hypothetical protein